MRNFKFLATAIVAIMLSCVLAAASFAAITPFTDVDDKNNEALSDAVALLEGIGVTKGTSETTFGTMELVTRQQMAAFVYRLLKPGKDMEGMPNSTRFTDLSDSTYFGYISWASGTGIIKGTSDTTFNPTGGITLQDAYTMVVRALDHETEEYIYPFTYIDKAEEIGLDEGLDSVVGYTTKLTRGDVAIILYNAFFAETGEERSSKYLYSYGSGEDSYSFEFIEDKYYVSIAEKIYDVEQGKFIVRATPKYAFNDTKDSAEFYPLCDEFEEDMLLLQAVVDGEPIAEFYYEFDKTNLKGSADDYIMNELEVFYTFSDEEGNRGVDKVYFMNGGKRVLESNSVSGFYMDGNNEGEYYYCDLKKPEDARSTDVKTEGYVQVNNETIYFYDAPYTYLKPDYNKINLAAVKAQAEAIGMDYNDLLAELRKQLRNANNVKLIDIKCLDVEKGTYVYYLDTEKPVDTPEGLINHLQRIYSNGVYNLKFYDINSDGIYDYAHYMPATYGFMDGDTRKDFADDMTGNAPIRKENKGSDLDVPFVPTIYYNGANVTGTKFEDGNFVLAYLNPEANMIDVMYVIKPYNGYANLIRYNHGIIRLDSQQFQTAYAYRVVENFWDGNDSKNKYIDNGTYIRYIDYYNHPSYFWAKRSSSHAQIFNKIMEADHNAVGEVFDVYAYKAPFAGAPVLLWYDHIEDATMSFDMDELAIPVSNEKNAGETLTEFVFDDVYGDKVHYARVYYNGKIEYVPLNTDDMYPSLGEGYKKGDYNLSLIEGQDSTYAINRAYVDKICKVKIDANGHYTLVPLLHAEDDEGLYAGTNRDSSVLKQDGYNKQYGNDLGYEVSGLIKKVAGTRFALVEETSGDTLLGDFLGLDKNATTIEYFDITAATRIVIKNVTKKERNEIKEFEYLEFDASNFKSSTSADSPLTNIQYILKGNPSSTSRADLVLLYAEAENFEFDVKAMDQSWRIVTDSAILKDANGKFRNHYRLFNVYTGEVEEDVAGEEKAEKAKDLDDAVKPGTVVKIKNGFVDEDGDAVGKIDTSVTDGLVYITEYDEEYSFIGVVPAKAVEKAMDLGGSICCGTTFKEFVEDFVYEGNEKNFVVDKKTGEPAKFETVIDSKGKAVYGGRLFYEVTDDTIITVINSKEAGNAKLSSAEFKLADISAIKDNNKDFRCYNEKVRDKKNEIVTKYADYIKAYVYTDEAKVEDAIPEASLIIIVVNGKEDLIFTDYDKNFDHPQTCDSCK